MMPKPFLLCAKSWHSSIKKTKEQIVCPVLEVKEVYSEICQTK